MAKREIKVDLSGLAWVAVDCPTCGAPKSAFPYRPGYNPNYSCVDENGQPVGAHEARRSAGRVALEAARERRRLRREAS